MQKTNKRIRNATIQAMIFNIVVTFILVGFLVSYIVPSIFSIREKTQDLRTTLTTYSRIQKEGLSLQEFTSLYTENKNLSDPYVVNLLNNLDEDFYNQNLINTQEWSYDEFLINKTQYTLEKKASDEFLQMDRKIRTIIPSYSDRPGLDGVISDFDFISYVESVLFTFNLQTEDSIGVGNIEPVVDTSVIDDSDKSAWTDESLFFIPLNLQLVWQKKDILDFIHFLENVGTINIDEGQITSYTDTVIQKPLEWEVLTREYNIYENQLADIEYVTMSEYIDASAQPSNQDLVSFIRSSQPRERFEVEMKVRFYISGLPDYKVEAFINDVVDRFTSLKKILLPSISKNKEILRNTKSWDVLLSANTIESLGYVLENIGKSANTLKKDFLKDKTQSETIYEKATELNEQIDRLEEIYRTNQQIIDTVK